MLIFTLNLNFQLEISTSPIFLHVKTFSAYSVDTEIQQKAQAHMLFHLSGFPV